jgi:exosortase
MQNQTNIKVWSERWRLGALERPELVQIGLASVIIGMLFMMFHMLGNTVENVNSRSAFQWMFSRWHDTVSFGADYSHGYFIPFVSLGIIWYRRKEIFSVETGVDWRGLVVVVGALVMHWLGAKMQQTRLSLMSLIMLIWGVPFYLFGWKLAKSLIFPCAYLIFCIPLNFLDALTFPLQRLATAAGAGMIQGLGIEVVRRGTMIFGDGFQLNVEAPCSGLRSLLAMTALTAVYAFFTQSTLLKKWILFISSIPLAVAGNIARIISIALVSRVTGQDFGTGVYHDFSGYILFTASITLMVVVGSMLNMDFKETMKKWKSALLSRT